MRLVALLSCLAVAAAVPAGAAAPPVPRWNPKAPENAQLQPSFSFATVAPVLNAVGARYQRSGTEPGKQGILVTFLNGRKALISFASCDAAGNACKALSIQAYWVKSANVPIERTAKAIELFNQRYSFAKAYVAPDGRSTMQRYLTADFGFIRGDLAVNLLVFSELAEKLAVEFLEPLEKVVKKP